MADNVVGHAPALAANEHQKPSRAFFLLVGLWEIIMVLLFGTCATYSEEADGGALTDANQAAVNKASPVFMDVHVMIFIGFGYLMVFLRRHGYSSLGYTFLICAFVIQWYLLNDGFWHGVFHGHFETIRLNMVQFTKADFSAGAVMITYGVILGKVTPLQLTVISLLEVVLYAVNEQIGLWLQIADIGGSMVIHMFGAAFGLALSWFMVKPKAFGHKENSAMYHSDLFAMVGTVFLWLFWPSFNSALGTANTQHRAEINTLMALTASCVMAFITSHLVRHDNKFCMVDIQNATLAGGVAMGTAADMLIGPGPAFFIGAFAGIVSTLGFRYLLPALEKRNLHDTCGVCNLHFIPSVIGAIAGAIAASAANREDYGDEQLATIFPGRGLNDAGEEMRSASRQGGIQMLYALITLGIAILGGIFTAVLVRQLESAKDEHLFDDQGAWEVPAEDVSLLGGSDREEKSLAAMEHRIRALEAALNLQTHAVSPFALPPKSLKTSSSGQSWVEGPGTQSARRIADAEHAVQLASVRNKPAEPVSAREKPRVQIVITDKKSSSPTPAVPVPVPAPVPVTTTAAPAAAAPANATESKTNADTQPPSNDKVEFYHPTDDVDPEPPGMVATDV